MDREIKRKNTRFKKAGWIAGGLLLLAGTTVWTVLRASTTVYNTDSIAITYGEVVEGEFNDYIRLSGNVETGINVQVSALENGIVQHRCVEEGAFVNEGDIILTLNNPNLRQQILDSESQLAERQNMLRDTEIAMENNRLQLRQDILSTQMESTRLKRIFMQQQQLFKEHLTSHEDFIKAKEDYNLSCERIKLLSERIYQDSLYRSVQLDMMRESLSNMRQNFELVRQRADNLNIRASHTGQLGSLNAEIGQNIAVGQLIGQINILNDYKIVAKIDEHYIDRILTGLQGSMERNNETYPVNIKKIYPEVADGQFRIDLIFSSSFPKNIRVGQTCHINLLLGDPVKTIMVPRGSFFQSTGGQWAYVMDADGKSAKKRNIKLGRQNPQYYEVIEGLAPGEKIITSSYADFGEADRVAIRQ